MNGLTPEQATRFLLLAGRTAQQKSDPYLDLIRKLRTDLDALEAATYKMFDELNTDFRNELFKLHGVPEDDQIRDKLHDNLSAFYFGQNPDIEFEVCMAKFQEWSDARRKLNCDWSDAIKKDPEGEQ